MQDDIDKYSFEFSKLYTRLMRLELHLKQRAIKSVLNYYKQNPFKTFEQFFQNKNRLQRYNNKNGNILLNIIKNNNLDETTKFTNLVQKLYLSDALHLVLFCNQFFENAIINAFYVNVPTKYTPLKTNWKNLSSLRNDIAHYNISNYKKHKKEYWDALFLFEKHLGHNTKGIQELPSLSPKPSTRDILVSISNLRPDLLFDNIISDNTVDNPPEYPFNKQRLLLEIYDEIALYNGINTSELHSPWSILREMFRIKKNTNSNSSDEIVQIKIL